MNTSFDFKDFVPEMENALKPKATIQTNTNMAMRDYTLSTSNYCVSPVCKRNTTPVNLGFAHFGYGRKKNEEYKQYKNKYMLWGAGISKPEMLGHCVCKDKYHIICLVSYVCNKIQRLQYVVSACVEEGDPY